MANIVEYEPGTTGTHPAKCQTFHGNGCIFEIRVQEKHLTTDRLKVGHTVKGELVSWWTLVRLLFCVKEKINQNSINIQSAMKCLLEEDVATGPVEAVDEIALSVAPLPAHPVRPGWAGDRVC